MVRLSSKITLAATILSSTALNSVLAAPAPQQSVDFPSWSREPQFTAYGKEGAAPTSFRPITDDKVAALQYLSQQTGVTVNELEVTDDYVGAGGVRFVYVKRVLNGKRIANQVANVAIKDGKVLSFGNSFPRADSLERRAEPQIDEPKPAVTIEDAIKTAESTLGISKNEIEPFTRYVETADGKYEYAWCFQLQSAPEAKKLQWYEVDVSAKTGKIISVNNWVNEASYRVVDFTATDPNPEKDSILVKDPANPIASPNGWHTGTTTSGNNARVFKTSAGGSKETSGGPNNDYLAQYDVNSEPSTASNVAASATNVFYVNNMMHDLFYQYGFTEAAGNFQNDNFDKGGKGGDAVEVSTQDPNGTDNATFGTPPDGQKPRMTMFVFTDTNPQRDGSMENDIPIHEYGHGISNRLTGGPANSNCLPRGESGGMGEGWSDTLAIIIQRKANHTRETDLAMGTWVTNSKAGIRQFPYSTSLTRNTHKYSTLKTQSQVHRVGEVWATMWNEVYWNLVDQAGFSEDIFNAKQEKGNIVALQLLIDSLQLQPCRPTFISSRDAVLQADENRYGGKFKCAIWKGFAKRGLGAGADASRNDNFDVPAECQ